VLIELDVSINLRKIIQGKNNLRTIFMNQVSIYDGNMDKTAFKEHV
jgi:hypothetical protein